jgi:hypothetical protein
LDISFWSFALLLGGSDYIENKMAEVYKGAIASNTLWKALYSKGPNKRYKK